MAITNYPEYPMEQIEFLRKVYPANGFKKTHELFNNKFGLHTESQVKHRIHKFGIRSNYDGKFKKGSSAWNKGMNLSKERPDIYNQYIQKIRYAWEKGQKGVTYKPIGTVSDFKEGMFIKIAEPSVWKSYSRYVYEKAHNCTLKKTDKVLHLDGNKYNDDIDNLFLVNDAIIARLNKQKLIVSDAEMTRNAVYREMILQKIKELENENG